MWNKIKQFYSPVLDVISFSLLILSIGYVIFSYPQLPDVIPTHFNIAGEADSWSGKVFLIGLLIIYLFIFTQTWIFNYFLFIKPEDPKETLHFINIPFVNKQELNHTQINLLRTLAVRMMASLNLMLSFLFASIIFGTIQVAQGVWKGLGFLPVLIGIVLITSIFYIWKMYRLIKKDIVTNKKE